LVVFNQYSWFIGQSDGEAKNKFMKKTSELIKLLEKRLNLYKKEEMALKVLA